VKTQFPGVEDVGEPPEQKAPAERPRKEMKKYMIRRAAQAVDISRGPASDAWKTATATKIDEFPWYKEGKKQGTTVRLLYDDKAIYALFVCDDSHIFSKTTELNGPVCTDSCVEFFATINPEKGPDYFNFEANCCGTFHLGYGPDRATRTLITPEPANRIKVATSVPQATKEESPRDNGWWLAAAIPFDVIAEMAGEKAQPKAGTIWRANFYRCGGKTDQQFGVWNPVSNAYPDYHRPEYFGRLKFE
jgi:hypothetical protein